MWVGNRVSILSSLTGAAIKPFLPYLAVAAIAGLGATLVWVDHRGYSRGSHEVQAQWDTAMLQTTQAKAKLESDYRTLEQQMASRTQEISNELHTQIDQTRTEYIVALDASRSGANQLREQFASCRASLPSATNNSSPTSSHDAAREPGLSPEDIQPFLLIGADANRVVAKLTACQEYVNSLPHQ